MFLAVCYAFVQNKMKLDPRSDEGIFVGYDSESPACLVYSPNNNGAKKIRCVKFSENFKEEVETPAVVYEDNYAIEEEQKRKS